jgi:predicted XRE-type DNA-binding protein
MSVKKAKPRAADGSGNVFADLGLPNPEQELVKASLTLRIHRIIRQRCLTQKEAAVLLGVKQPQVSLLMRNRSGNFSMGRLIDFLTALGQDVQITVRATRKEYTARYRSPSPAKRGTYCYDIVRS